MVEYRSGGQRAYLINHPDAAEHVLARNQANYANPPHPYAKLARVASPSGAFLLRLGTDWEGAEGQRRLRRIRDLSASRVEEWLEALEGPARRGETVDLLPPLKTLTLRVMVEALFGIAAPAGAERFVAAVRRNEEIMAQRPALSPFAVSEPPPPDLHATIQEQESFVARLIAEAGWRGADPTAVLRTILNSFNGPATALAWTLVLLAGHPQVQRRLQEEVDGDRLGYARNLLQESMRLYPPAWMLGRTALSDDQVCGTRVLKGALVSISPYTLHRHPAFWREPRTFDPERFTAERSRDRPRYAYIPFGGGTRQCTASHVAIQQLQAMLAAVARRIEVSPAPGCEIRPWPLISLRPHPGAWVRLAVRKRT